MKIGILQTGHAPDALIAETGDYDTFFQKLLANEGFEYETWNVVDLDFPDGPHAADGFILTGSRHGAYEDLPFIKPLEQFIRDTYAAKVPMVGICFGHQIIAQAMGGTVVKHPHGWSVGRQTYKFGDEDIVMNAWHQDQISVLPDTAQVCGTSDFCEYAALVYGNDIFTVQAHPEFEGSFVKQLAETRGRGVVPDQLLDEAVAQVGEPVHKDLMARRIGAFFKERNHAS
ncbi:type 1 glutamine amidotransferase [Marivivens aquimaris]|uniref:type 1 glutamine amidotransferase n=1 Tax=Marivivens aquimaris TaxID=2774876 RepID=UPI0018812C6A|nr:type 1 glutamine amidotransferase [Marivivens aquimaris]